MNVTKLYIIINFFIFMSRVNFPSIFVPFVGLVFPRITTRAFFLFVENIENEF